MKSIGDKVKSLLGGSEEENEPVVSARENRANRDHVIQNWSLGPDKATVELGANADYWQKMAEIWDIPEAEARRQLCANCEYFDNTPLRLSEIESIPLDRFDMDGGGRGYCVRFDFICHNLRVCQAWEEKDFEGDD